MLDQAEVVSGQSDAGNVQAEAYEELLHLSEVASRTNPVAEALPKFIISQGDGIYAQGHFELGLRDDLGMDIRRWPDLG